MSVAELEPLEYTFNINDVNSYITKVNKIPMLTREKEYELGKRLKESNDIHSYHTLISSHLRLVVSIARKYQGYGLDNSDLIQEGNIGLMKAVGNYDPDDGCFLSTYATYFIKGEIHEFIFNNLRIVKIATSKPQRKLFFNLRKYKELNKTLTQSQIDIISKDLEVPEKDIREMEIRFGNYDSSIEYNGIDDGDGYSINDMLVAEGYSPDEIMESNRLIELQSGGIWEAMKTLDSRSKRIVESRWLGENVGLKELSSEFGVSMERIRQIEVAAMKKMRITVERYT